MRRDDDAVERLRSAEADFEKLSSIRGLNSSERRRFRIWRFLCVLNAVGREKEATELLQSLLDEDTGDSFLLVWTMVRQLDFDRVRSRRALSDADPEQPDYLNRIGLLVGMMIDDGEAAAALPLLDNVKGDFQLKGRIDTWHHWRVQCLLADEKKDAEREARKVEARGHQLHLLYQVSAKRYLEGGQAEAFLGFLEGAYAAKAIPFSFSKLARFRAGKSNGSIFWSGPRSLSRRYPRRPPFVLWFRPHGVLASPASARESSHSHSCGLRS